MALIHRRTGAVSAAIAAALAVVVSPALAAGPASAASGAPQGASAFGSIDKIFCTSAGNCTAIGSMTPPISERLFAVSEKNGVWGAAQAVPGIAALIGAKTGGARVTELSCSSAGNCGAGGSYVPPGHFTRAFVVSEKNGHWGKAEQVPGLAKLATGRFSEVETISCPSPGNCGAGGSYTTSAANNGGAVQETFVVSEKHGSWGKAEETPGTAKLNKGAAEFNQVTCTSAGNCLGVGNYEGKKSSGPFAVTETNGTWGKARTFPRIMALTAVKARDFIGFAQITRISCRSIGNCTAVGFYYYDEDLDAVFAFSQKNGVWGAITTIPFTGDFPGGVGQINIRLLSCPSQGNCVAGGGFGDPNDPELGQAYFVTEKNGVWGSAEIPPGVLALTGSSEQSSLIAVACSSAGSCSAAGGYESSGGGGGAYVITEENGVWGMAAQLGAMKPLNSSQLGVSALSCGTPGNCSLGGAFSELPSSQHVRPYVADQKNGIWGDAEPVKGIAP